MFFAENGFLEWIRYQNDKEKVNISKPLIFSFLFSDHT